jgi:hypothetical protein
MGWMKRIYTMVQEGTFETEFSSKYYKAKANKKKTMLFNGIEITMKQAEGINNLAKDAVKMFKT